MIFLGLIATVGCGTSVEDTASTGIGREPTGGEINRACGALAQHDWDYNSAAAGFAVSDPTVVTVMAAIVTVEGAGSEEWCSENAETGSVGTGNADTGNAAPRDPETGNAVTESAETGDAETRNAETEDPATGNADAGNAGTENDRERSAVVMLGSAATYVEGVGEKQDIMPSVRHVDLNDSASDDFVTYNSVPPTSGDHWSTPVRCGFYIQAVPDELIVHNLEHSNIVISYNLPSDADVDALKDVYDGLNEIWRNHFTVVRPYGEIEEGQVTLSAWGVLDVMDGVDEERILRFFNHYVGSLGPEGAISCRGM